MSERGAETLLASTFTFGVQGSVAARAVGRTVTAHTDAHMRADIVSWPRSQELCAGIALEGATLREDLDDDATLYGETLANSKNRQSACVPPPLEVARATAPVHSTKERKNQSHLAR